MPTMSTSAQGTRCETYDSPGMDQSGDQSVEVCWGSRADRQGRAHLRIAARRTHASSCTGTHPPDFAPCRRAASARMVTSRGGSLRQPDISARRVSNAQYLQAVGFGVFKVSCAVTQTLSKLEPDITGGTLHDRHI